MPSLGAVSFIQTGLAVALALAAGPARAAEPIELTLPFPTGPSAVGTAALHLVDRSRPDPWVPSRPARELMVSLWYPARQVGCRPVAPWLPQGAADALLAGYGVEPGAVLLPDTHGHDRAPVRRESGPLPVVLYSPGYQGVRAFNTLVVEELASRGYLVVTVDHTYESAVVEFPDGRVVTSVTGTAGPNDDALYEKALRVRVLDLRFVLDSLAVVAAGGNPDAEHRPLPPALRGAFDPRRVGMFGHSLGGATVAAAMLADARIQAGLSLDGPVYGPVVDAGLDRPFMLLSSPRGVRELNPRKQAFWSHLRGWRRDLTLLEAGHLTFGDFELFIPALAQLLGFPPEDEIGEIAAPRAIAVQRAYPRAFFDLHLRHVGHLLDGPSPDFPEVIFVP